MTCLRELVAFAEPQTPLLALDTPACGRTSPKESAAISGPVETAESSENNDALLLSEERLLLRYEIKEANRQHKPVSSLNKRLRDVTHRLLGAL